MIIFSPISAAVCRKRTIDIGMMTANGPGMIAEKMGTKVKNQGKKTDILLLTILLFFNRQLIAFHAYFVVRFLKYFLFFIKNFRK
jgi:hypothetical protein